VPVPVAPTVNAWYCKYALPDKVTGMVWVQHPVWSDYLCVRIISSVCFEINLLDSQEGSMGVLYNL